MSVFSLGGLGCGARTGLEVSGSGGSSQGGVVGSAVSTSASGASTGSTSSGGSKICYGLQPSGPPIQTIDGIDDTNFAPNERRPLLVPAESGNVAVVVGEDPLGGPTNLGAIRAAGFAPWGAWPQNLGATTSIASLAGPSFKGTRAYGDGKAGFELALVPDVMGAPPGVFVTSELHTSQSYGPLPPGAQIPAASNAKPLFFTATPTGRLVGVDAPIPGGGHLGVVHMPDMPAPTLPGASIVACGNSPLEGAAIDVAPYALIASSNSSHQLGCAGPPSMPSTLIVDTWPSSGAPSPKTVIDGPTPIRQVELVKRSDGAWLVWQSDDIAGDPLSQPVFARRLDALGNTVAGPFTLVAKGGSQSRFGASAMGDELVIGYVEATVPSDKANLALRVFTSEGALDGSADLGTSSLPGIPGGPWWVDAERVSVLGSGDSVILAWDQHVTEPTSAARVVVERFTCTGPE